MIEKIKKIIFFLIITSFLIGGCNILADNNLPSPGITPDSPFYFFDNLLEKINLSLTFSPEGKAKKAFQYSKEKLAEARLMAFKNKIEDFKKAFQYYVEYLTMGGQKLKEAKNQGKNIEELTDLVAEVMFADMQIFSESLESMEEKLTEKEIETIVTKLFEGLGIFEEDEELGQKIGEKIKILEEKQKEKEKGKLSKIEKSISLGTYSFYDDGFGFISAQGTWISDTDLGYPVQSSDIICMKNSMLCTEAIAQISEDGFLFVNNELYDINTWSSGEIVTKPSDSLAGCTRYIMRIDRIQKQVTETRTTISREGMCEGIQEESIHLYLGDGIKAMGKLRKK